MDALQQYAHDQPGKSVLALALRRLVDQEGATTALWGARHPAKLDPVPEIEGWSLSDRDRELIDDLLAEHIKDPVGPEFMAPPARENGVVHWRLASPEIRRAGATAPATVRSG